MTAKAITFDFWNTLFVEGTQYQARVYDLRNEILLDAASEAGVPAEIAQVQDAWREAARDFETTWNAERVMTTFERTTLIFKYLGLPYDEGHIALTAKRIAEASLAGDLSPLPGVLEAIPKLAKHYVLGIVSDTGATPGRLLCEHLKRHKLHDCFTGFSFSDETGFVKPSPEAFGAALEDMGVKPQEAVHVGDIPRTDIAGALATGYKGAVLYTGHIYRDGQPEPTARIGNHNELFSLLNNVIGRVPKAM